jgi:hypothetical protein
MSIGQTLGIVTPVLLLGAFFTNGLIMLISPAWWFKLPSYVAFRGTLREREYVGKVSGRLQIRTLGLVFVSFTVYAVSRLFGVSPHFFRAIGSQADALILRSGRWLCFMICLAVIGCGFVMLLKPEWWAMKYMNAGETDEGRQALFGERTVRIMSLPILAVAAYFFYHCIAGR